MPLSDLWQSLHGDSAESEGDRDVESPHGDSAESDRDRDVEQDSDQEGSESESESHTALETQKLRNQSRTFKARVASLLSRQKKKIKDTLKPDGSDNEDADAKLKRSFQQRFLASRSTQWDPLEDAGNVHSKDSGETSGRRRAIYSYFAAFASAVRHFFHGPSAAQISHVISINTNDDCNLKLGSGIRGSSEVRSVTNNLQEHIVISEASEQPVWFSVHQPIEALERADTPCLYSRFMGWVLAFAGYVGWKLQVWGIPRDIFQNVRRQVVVFVGDALKVKDSLFKYFAETVQQQRNCSTKSFALQVHCLIHQVSLTRKNMVLGFSGYWSNVVRLGHLFESHTFRSRFRVAMAKIISENFAFIRVGDLPSDASHWHKQKIDGLRLHSDVGHMGFGGKKGSRGPKASTRLKGLLRILEKDNGDPRSEMFTHWCTGVDCCPGGMDEALTCMMTAYTSHFDHTCVPLLYRWKHAGAANNFVRDGFFLHGILQRTLESMPSMK